MVFLKDCFEKVDLKKNIIKRKKNEKILYPVGKELPSIVSDNVNSGLCNKLWLRPAKFQASVLSYLIPMLTWRQFLFTVLRFVL